MASSEFVTALVSVQKKLYGFAYSLTANQEDAEDLMQETMLKALNNEAKFVDDVNFRGWLFTIMRNIFINNYRKNINNKQITDSTDTLFHISLPQNSGIESPEGSMAIQEIQNAITMFSDEYKIPFTMHIEGYKYKEIAEYMNLPIGTVKSRIFFARKKLADELDEYDNR